MAYYLHHYFAPDFNHQHLRPKVMDDGNADTFNLGYVQNVAKGQVLAELLTIPDSTADMDMGLEQSAVDFFDCLPPSGPVSRDPAPSPAGETPDIIDSAHGLEIPGVTSLDPRYIYDTPVFPLGPNCDRDPEHPNRIIAQATGYCFYDEGLITVKKLLNVRQDINFSTGNILFAGDVLAHEDIFPGFHLYGNNILIKGRVDGGFIKAHNAVTCESGIKGAPAAMIEAEGLVRLAFCEGVTIKTAGNVVVEGSCMHSTIYAGGSVIVKGRLVGGSINAGAIVYAAGHIGDSQGAVTRITLGYNPFDLLKKKEIETEITVQSERKASFERQCRKGPLFVEECRPLIEMASRKLEILLARRVGVQRTLTMERRLAEKSRVVVPGVLHAGTEIRIGRAYFKAVDDYANTYFRLREDEINFASPALSLKAEANLAAFGVL